VHIMMYMFPRQFGLHNVFASLVDRRQTSQQFLDYTLREEEINQKFPKEDAEGRPHKVHIPKRLRGETQILVRRFMVLHSRCSYSELLQHYCPVRSRYLQALAAADIPRSQRKWHRLRWPRCRQPSLDLFYPSDQNLLRNPQRDARRPPSFHLHCHPPTNRNTRPSWSWPHHSQASRPFASLFCPRSYLTSSGVAVAAKPWSTTRTASSEMSTTSFTSVDSKACVSMKRYRGSRYTSPSHQPYRH
jgi:hypothetical protein